MNFLDGSQLEEWPWERAPSGTILLGNGKMIAKLWSQYIQGIECSFNLNMTWCFLLII